MAERSSLNQVVQMGPEATPGVAQAATRRLQSVSIEPTPVFEVDTFRSTGSKYQNMTTKTHEASEASIEGRPTYTELPYLLASIVGVPTVTPNADDPALNDWLFESSNTEDDVVKTFTIEHGSSVRADRFTYGLVNELTLSISKDSFEVSGSMIGGPIEDNVEMTTEGVTLLELIPMLADDVCVYVDTTPAALGTTKLTRLNSVEWSIGSRFSHVDVIDCEADGPAAHVEVEPDLTGSINVEADEQGMRFLETLRDGDTVYMRIAVTSKKYPGLKMWIDTAFNISDSGGFDDQDGLYSIEWSLVGTAQAAWEGRAFRVIVTNALTEL